jgi:hypothetical protein
MSSTNINPVLKDLENWEANLFRLQPDALSQASDGNLKIKNAPSVGNEKRIRRRGSSIQQLRARGKRKRLKNLLRGRKWHHEMVLLGRRCTYCLRFYQWKDRKGMENFQKNQDGLNGFRSRCKNCENMLREYRRLKLGKIKYMKKTN